MGNPYPGGGAREVVDFNLDVTGLTTDIRQVNFKLLNYKEIKS